MFVSRSGAYPSGVLQGYCNKVCPKVSLKVISTLAYYIAGNLFKKILTKNIKKSKVNSEDNGTINSHELMLSLF
jgi:hypothetical protein